MTSVAQSLGNSGFLQRREVVQVINRSLDNSKPEYRRECKFPYLLLSMSAYHSPGRSGNESGICASATQRDGCVVVYRDSMVHI